MKKLLTLVLFLGTGINGAFAADMDLRLDETIKLDDVIAFGKSAEFKKTEPQWTPVFSTGDAVYEITQDALYKRIGSGRVKIVSEKQLFINDDSYTYDIYKDKTDGTLLFYRLMAAEPGSHKDMIIVDERNKVYDGLDLPTECYFNSIRYIEDNQYKIACLDLYKGSQDDIKTLIVDRKGIRYTQPSRNITFKIKKREEKDTRPNYFLGIKKYDQKKITLMTDQKNYKFEDKKTKKRYAQKCQIMYDSYFWAKSMVKKFGACPEYPFGDFDLDWNVIWLTPEEKAKVYTGCDRNNTEIQSVEAFCKGIKD